MCVNGHPVWRGTPCSSAALACGSGLSPFLSSCCLSEENVSGRPVFPDASHWRPWAKGPRRKVVPIRSVTDPLVGKKSPKAEERTQRLYFGIMFIIICGLGRFPVFLLPSSGPPSFHRCFAHPLSFLFFLSEELGIIQGQ